MKALNFRELEVLVHQIQSELKKNHSAPFSQRMKLDKLVVLQRPHFIQQFIKNEWEFRFNNQLFIRSSLRPNCCYFILGRAPFSKVQSSPSARSAFDLSLSKILSGATLLQINLAKNDRVIEIQWEIQGELHSEIQSELYSSFAGLKKCRLFFCLIPSRPHLVLTHWEEGDQGYKVILSNRISAEQLPQHPYFKIETNSQFNKDKYSIENNWVNALPSAFLAFESWVQADAFELRVHKLNQILKERIRNTDKHLKEVEIALKKVNESPNFSLFAEAIATSLHELQPTPYEPTGAQKNTQRKVTQLWRYEGDTQILVDVPILEGLTPPQEINKYYRLEKRNQRKREELNQKQKLYFQKKSENIQFIEKLEHLKTQRPSPHWEELIHLEKELGLPSPELQDSSPINQKKVSPDSRWAGKKFKSKEGLSIWVGKNKVENIDLSLRVARGNDLWFHVKGRPGAHVVVPLPPKRTASLETLLDAATLCIFYSGGEKWGKVDVDYTFQKYLKKIKGSTEVSYSQNKTLSVEFDSVRFNRLSLTATESTYSEKNKKR